MRGEIDFYIYADGAPEFISDLWTNIALIKNSNELIKESLSFFQ